MSDYSTVEDPKLHTAPLTSVRVDDGSPYTRFRDVEKEITHILQSAEPAKMLIASIELQDADAGLLRAPLRQELAPGCQARP